MNRLLCIVRIARKLEEVKELEQIAKVGGSDHTFYREAADTLHGAIGDMLRVLIKEYE